MSVEALIVGTILVVSLGFACILYPAYWRQNLQAISAFWLLVIAVVGVDFLASERADRRADRVQRAWTLLSNVAEFKEVGFEGKSVRRAKVGNVGQIAALRSLIDDGARLDGVFLSEFYLERANLRDGSFRYANIDGARLQDADLTDADLTDTNFGLAELPGAILDGANLTRTLLETAKGLEQAQIDRACYDGKHPPTLPVNLKSPQKTC